MNVYRFSTPGRVRLYGVIRPGKSGGFHGRIGALMTGVHEVVESAGEAVRVIYESPRSGHQGRVIPAYFAAVGAIATIGDDDVPADVWTRDMPSARDGKRGRIEAVRIMFGLPEADLALRAAVDFCDAILMGDWYLRRHAEVESVLAFDPSLVSTGFAVIHK